MESKRRIIYYKTFRSTKKCPYCNSKNISRKISNAPPSRVPFLIVSCKDCDASLGIEACANFPKTKLGQEGMETTKEYSYVIKIEGQKED